MRGKAAKIMAEHDAVGITPAYAGKSVFVSSGGLLLWDHPRLCGEKGEKELPKLLEAGSPPPMRGKVAAEDVRLSRIRITPAYAGKSLTAFHSLKPLQDHPRLCGEKQPLYFWFVRGKGSPPPMRGKVCKT